MLRAGLARACRLAFCGLKTATNPAVMSRLRLCLVVAVCSCLSCLSVCSGSGAELLTRERAHGAAHFAELLLRVVVRLSQLGLPCLRLSGRVDAAG